MTKNQSQKRLKRQLICVFPIIIGAILGYSTVYSAKAGNNNADNELTVERKSAAQIIRLLLDLPRTVAAGGSRNGFEDVEDICLITPVIKPRSNPVTATAVVPMPLIVTSKPLNELTIRSMTGDKKKIFTIRATSKKTIQTPIKWPLAPITEGDEFLLELRGLNSMASEKARIIIQGGRSIQANNRIKQDLSGKYSDKELLDLITTLPKTLAIEIALESSLRTQKEISKLHSDLSNLGCKREK